MIHVTGKRVGVLVKLRHCQRTVENEKIDGVCQIAESAAKSWNDRVFLNDTPGLVALLFGDIANESPEGKRFTGTNDESIEFFTGETDVHSFVFLQHRIDTGTSFDDLGMVLGNNIRQALAAQFCSECFMARQVLQMAA